MANSYFGIMDLIIAVSGIYVIVQYVLMVKTKKLRQNMLLPKGVNLSKCRDREGFIGYIGLKQLAFGITALLNGVLGLLQDLAVISVPAVTNVSMVLFVAAAGWYIYAYKQGMKKYWKI